MATKKAEKEFVSPLEEGKTITIELLDKPNAKHIKDRDEAIMLSGTTRNITLQCILDKVGGRAQGLKNPFTTYYEIRKESKVDAKRLGKQLQAHLEDELGLANGALDLTLPTLEELRAGRSSQCLWLTSRYNLSFSKRAKSYKTATMTLDMGDPMDFIKYLIALCSDEIANNWSERKDRPTYRFAIRDLKLDVVDALDGARKKAQVDSKLLEILEKVKNEGDRKAAASTMYTIYKYFVTFMDSFEFKAQEKVTPLWDVDRLFLHLQELNTTPKRVKVLHDAITLSASDADAYKAFFKAQENGIIKKVSGVYSHTKLGVEIGSQPEEVISWLQLPAQKDIKAAILQSK